MDRELRAPRMKPPHFRCVEAIRPGYELNDKLEVQYREPGFVLSARKKKKKPPEGLYFDPHDHLKAFRRLMAGSVETLHRLDYE